MDRTLRLWRGNLDRGRLVLVTIETRKGLPLGRGIEEKEDCMERIVSLLLEGAGAIAARMVRRAAAFAMTILAAMTFGVAFLGIH